MVLMTELRTCDHRDCPADALVRVVIAAESDLLFCGHHFHEVEETVVRAGYGVESA